MNFFQRSWLVIKEFGAVAYATRVPTLVVALVVFLMARTEPAQDMLAEAVTEAFHLTAGTAPEAGVPVSYWKGRWFTILVSLAILAFTVWYWARVVLMFHRAMPDLADNAEGQYRAEWRPRIVLWWPRLVGLAVFLGCAYGLRAVAGQYSALGADADELGWAGWAVFAMGLGFLVLLVTRRHYLGDPGFKAPWALNGALDPRAPFRRLPDIRSDAAGASVLARRVGNIFLVFTVVLTLVLITWAAASPVTLGDLFGGLAIALLAAAVAVPLFTLLTIFTATTRFPWFGVVAGIVILVPMLNGCWSDRIDNHDVRTVGDKALPARWTVDEAFKAWLEERHARTETVYNAACVREELAAGRTDGACRSPEKVAACGDSPTCRLKERPPFIVVATEGGASRAGYWTVLALGEFVRQDPKVRDSIFAISSVSGGSLGAVLMRALIDLDRIQETELGWPAERRVVCDSGEAVPQPYLSCLRVFMRRDFLAAAFTGMFFTDLLQRILPAAWITLPDRAETLERSWERSWDDMVASLKAPKDGDADRLKALQARATGLFARGFANTWGKDGKAFGDGQAIKPWPILLLNGTAVETGRRVITSNVEVLTPAFHTTTRFKDSPSVDQQAALPCMAALTAYRQDEAEKRRVTECSIWEAPAVHDPLIVMKVDIPISTAVNMSARFPVVEPAGGIVDAESRKRAFHVVDGGIYENFGAQTIKDLLHFVLAVRGHKEWPSATGVRPMVVLISSDHELDGVRQVTAAYAGTDDRADDGQRLPAAERAMKLGCRATGNATASSVPLCDATLMRDANEVLGDPVALYRTRSGRGESGILSLREQLAQWRFYDENFFHFRQCMNGTLRPASMTWYVSPISQRFMDELLPSVHLANPEQRAPKLSFADWMKLVQATPSAGPSFDDPCQNHAELKRLIIRHQRILDSKR